MQLLTDEAVAEQLNIPPNAMAEMRVASTGPRFIMLSPKRIRYRPEAIAEWLAEREFTKTDEYEKTIGRPRKSGER